jgi:cyclopropane-fatty-acyl-phospholipid synthase
MITNLALAKLESVFRAADLKIEVTAPTGETTKFGDGPATVTVSFKEPWAWEALISLDENKLAEAYVTGALDLEGSFTDALKIRSVLKRRQGLPLLMRFIEPLFAGRTKANRTAISKHYDLDPRFYLAFLDPVWPAYSQGIYEAASESLSTAIQRKFDFARSALEIGPESHVVEIGPGWGAWLSYLRPIGARVTALTNSSKMRTYLEKAFSRPAVQIHEGDFLKYQPGQRFDGLTMMGVLEHLPWYEEVCKQIRALLKPGACAYLDASAAKAKYAMTEFIYRHVYPNNPHSFLHLDGFLKAAAKVKLEVVSLNDDSDNYRKTIRCWAENLEKHREELESKFGSYDFRRFRMYLWGSVHAFEQGDLQCHRLVLRAPA